MSDSIITANSISTCDISENKQDSILSDTSSIAKARPSWTRRAWRNTMKFLGNVFSPERDSSYIEVQNYNWCAELQMTSRFEIYQMESAEDLKMEMSPKWRTRIGPFFGWRWAFAGYNIDLKSIFSNSDDIDLGGSIYSARFGIDLFLRKVGGNYNIRKMKINDMDYSSLLHGEPFDGISIGMTRLNFYYVFNYKRYSHQAAFSQTNRQLRSAGSPIAGIAYARNTIKMDWAKMNTVFDRHNITDIDFSSLSEDQRNSEIDLTGGYGYNWVFTKNWLAAGELTGSIGYLLHKFRVEEPDDKGDLFKRIDDFRRNNLAFNGNMRLALLYNSGPIFTGLQAIIFYYQYGNANVQNRNVLGSLYAYVGINF